MSLVLFQLQPWLEERLIRIMLGYADWDESQAERVNYNSTITLILRFYRLHYLVQPAASPSSVVSYGAEVVGVCVNITLLHLTPFNASVPTEDVSCRCHPQLMWREEGLRIILWERKWCEGVRKQLSFGGNAFPCSLSGISYLQTLQNSKEIPIEDILFVVPAQLCRHVFIRI